MPGTLKQNCFVFIFLICFYDAVAQNDFCYRLADSAATLVRQKVTYDLSYYSIAYPNGDVPVDRGVCTDVIIRAYRKLNIDLQQLVHEDMRNHFSQYPRAWSMTGTDKNIDHRRVPNLMTFFKRSGASLPVSENAIDYKPGDIVCWSLNRGMKHIGLVVKQKSADKKRHLIVHNIGDGQVLEDWLFNYPIIGHYRYSR